MKRFAPLWPALLLLLPYVLYLLHGGTPRNLPSYLAALLPLLIAAAYLLHHPRMRTAIRNHQTLLLWGGLVGILVMALITSWWWNPRGTGAEMVNFLAEYRDTMQGGFFTHPTEHRTEFAIHWSPVLLLPYPLFTLFPHTFTLFVVSALLFCLAVPAARRFLRNGWPAESALLLALGFAFFPSILVMPIDFSPVRFAPFVMWSLLAAYKEDRRGLGVIAVIACWCVKETTLLSVMMLSVVALLQRRGAFWFLFPGLAGASLFLLSNQWLLPYFADTAGRTSTVAAQFGYWGQNVPDVLSGFAQDPQSVAGALLRPNNAAYIFKLGHGVLWLLPLASPLTIMALPEMLVNMMAGYNPSLMDPSRFGPWTSLVGHYSATIGIVLWAAATESLSTRQREGETTESREERAWRRARLLFLAVLSTIIYPSNAESL